MYADKMYKGGIIVLSHVVGSNTNGSRDAIVLCVVHCDHLPSQSGLHSRLVKRYLQYFVIFYYQLPIFLLRL